MLRACEETTAKIDSQAAKINYLKQRHEETQKQLAELNNPQVLPVRRIHLAAPEEINADMLSFWNGKGGHTWVARQEHTDITLMPVTDALLAFAAPRTGAMWLISSAPT